MSPHEKERLVCVITLCGCTAATVFALCTYAVHWEQPPPGLSAVAGTLIGVITMLLSNRRNGHA